MTTPKSNAKFDCDTWEEKDIAPLKDSTPGIRLTRTRTERTFRGALEGKGITEYNFVYHDVPGSEPAKMMCTYNGTMYFKGTAEGYDGEGELAFTCTGTWGKGGEMAAVGEWVAIPGSGKGSLAGVKEGSGGYHSTGKMDQTCWINLV